MDARAQAHAVLGIAEDAPLDAARRAFRRLATRTHPDRGGDADRFAAVAEAWGTVRTLPRRRRSSPYDRHLGVAPPLPAATVVRRPVGRPTAASPLTFAHVLERELARIS